MEAIILAAAPSLERCRSYCTEHELQILSEHSTLPEALAAARQHAATLVASELGDLGTSPRELSHITRKLTARGAHWVAIAEGLSSTQKPVPRLLEALRRLASQRMSAHRAAASRLTRSRRIVGEAAQVRYGWRIDPADPTALIECPQEQAALALILERRRAGDGYTAICRQLEAREHKPRGKRWYPATIEGILKREEQRRKIA